VGRHAAPDGASSDPLVSEALAQRPGHPSGAHSVERADGSEVGWPAPSPGDGRGVGWPRDLPGTEPSDAKRTGKALRRGLRRLFGAGRAA
jgi:hypothetical protein